MPRLSPQDDSIGGRRRRMAEALADPTRFAILELLERAGEPKDVSEITEAVGVHHTAIRAHLAKLRDVGLVTEQPAAPQGRGRPKLLYSAVRSPSRPEAGIANGAGVDDAQRDSYRELSSLLTRALATGRTPRQVGREAGLESARRQPELGTVERIEAEAVTLGFDPKRRSRGDRTELVLRHCPFGDVAAEDPDTICSLHLGLAEGIAEAGGDVEVVGMVVRDPHRAGCRLQLQHSRPRPDDSDRGPDDHNSGDSRP
jgi:predicted ArsR family transcriptional regulator